MILLWIIIYFALCLLVGWWALSLKRNGNSYMILSVLFTPLIIAILLAFLGANKKAVAIEKETVIKKKMEKANREREAKEKINASWKELLIKNDFSGYIELFETNKLNSADVILALNENDLEKMGIQTIGDRKRIIQIFRNIG